MYELGVTVAFFLACLSVLMTIVRANSLASKNLRKVGLRYSWYTGKPTEIGGHQYAPRPFWMLLKSILYISLTYIWVIFSWLYVAVYVFQFLYGLSKDFGAPSNVKEFRWRLKNTDMSFDALVEWLYVFSETQGTLEEFRSQVSQDVLLALQNN